MNPLLLDRPLLCFDIESTGTDVCLDRIITLAAVKLSPADLLAPEKRETRTWMFHPQRAIPAASTRVHGITDDMVKGKPSFERHAREIHDFFAGADLLGYNLLKFDVPILWEELFRANIEWSLSGVIIDASEIFRKKEPRTLVAAVKKFCGREHTGAHEALADVEATLAVLEGQRQCYADLTNMNVHGLAEFSAAEEWEGQPAYRLDLAGYVIRSADGVARYTLKKVRGVAVADDPGFGEWMLRNTFPEQTKRVLRELLNTL